jgi:sugar diacid utilization regulator
VAEVFEQLAGQHPSSEGFSAVGHDEIRGAGSMAAEEGMTADQAVDLYLTTVARAWMTGPGDASAPATAQAVLTAVRTAVPILVQGYQNAGQALIRLEETARVEFIDDLLRGDADVASMVQRAEPFGLDLSAAHQVVLAGRRSGTAVHQRDEVALSRAVIKRYGDRDVLVTTKARHLVAVLPSASTGSDIDAPARQLLADLRWSDPRTSWRFAVGRPFAGAYGVARSYQQAREAMTLAERLHPDVDMVPTRDLLIYRVLGRDRPALSDLVESVLTPLTGARGGAAPLVDTLEAYFTSDCVSTATARQLHVSARTVTYRLAKITALTGYDPAIPLQRLTLQAAVIGARLLPWPSRGHGEASGH